MKRVLSCLLICALLGCSVLALASCSIKLGPTKSTDETTAPADPEPQPTEQPETTVPEEGISTGEDPDNNFGPVHNF